MTEEIDNVTNYNVKITANISNKHDLICAPLTTYEEVNTWLETEPRPNWAEKVLLLRPKVRHYTSGERTLSRVNVTDWAPLRQHLSSSLPKTLLCHDYKGGYGEDRFVEGSDKFSEYRFFHWAGIDTFVYFSHHLLTIPPLVWINSAHLHGVKVLGTLITEWKDGLATWKKILQTTDTIDRFAENLAAVCHYFGFEGYLLNVENTLEKSDIDKLVYFITTLRIKLLSLVPNAEVIWYDSVTVEGHLKWQNQLNNLNKPLFDACDGIFLNYGWSEADLLTSIQNADLRKLDIYVGVDVFGRGVYGGGGFNTNLAMELIRKHGLSAAVFAPGWVHETQPVEHFTSLEYLFWQKVWPYLYIHGPSMLPFATSFCQGFGKKKYKQGVGVSQPWYNLSLQAYQPSVASDMNETVLSLLINEKVPIPQPLVSSCVQHYLEDAFNGGGCLKIQRPNDFKINLKPHSYYQRIFACRFHCQDLMLVSCATKKQSKEEDTVFNLVLILEDRSGKQKKYLLKEHREIKQEPKETKLQPIVIQALKPSELLPFIEKWKLIINRYENNGWRQSFYPMIANGSKIVEVGVELAGSAHPVLLGHLEIQQLAPRTH